MRDEKIQKHPPQDSGGYRRRLKEEEAYKGFTLVELIVVIVILAILAAILIPGLLKWIDQAKDKKYELEAREIALAAEGALTKMYAQGKQVSVKSGKLEMGSPDLMQDESFRTELSKFTDADVKEIKIYGNADGGTPEKWGGSATGFEIAFTASDEAEITAELLPGTGRWVINKPSDGIGGENPEEDPKISRPQKIGEAIMAVLREQKAQDKAMMVYSDGDIVDDQNILVGYDDLFKEELKKLVSDPEDVDRMLTYDFRGEKWPGTEDDYIRPWNGNFSYIGVFYQDSDGVYRAVLYSSSTDSWECIEGENINEVGEQYNDWYMKYIY